MEHVLQVGAWGLAGEGQGGDRPGCPGHIGTAPCAGRLASH